MSRSSRHDETTAPPLAGLCHGLAYAARGIGVIVALVGAGHLAAWLGGYMANLGVSTITMKTNAAMCLMLSGLALLLLMPEQARLAHAWAGRIMAVIVAVVGMLTLSENLMGWNLGIDQLLARESVGALAVTAPNRMAMPASTSFTLIGLALLLLGRKDSRWQRAAHVLALGVCLIALLGTIGHWYGAQGLYAIARFTGIAWPTAVALLALGLGLLLARPAGGLMAQVTADDPGGANLRRWLPVLLLPVVFGWLRLFGEQHGWFDAPMGTAMMMILFIVALSFLAYMAARPVSRSAASVKRAQMESDTSAEFLKIINQAAGTRALVQAAVTFFHRQSGCEAVGVRLKEGEDFPYYEARGFPEEFLLLENSLCERDADGQIQRDNIGNPCIACMCGNVICGRFDPSKPFFSPQGSFWSNCTTELLARTTDAERQARTRNRCNGQGYESVALIPLRVGDERLGLLQLNDKQRGRFTAGAIALWERLASYLAVALAKSRAEEALAESRERLDLALRSARMATFDWDIVKDKRTWSDGVHRLLGTKPETFTGAAEEFFKVVHPDDREAVKAALAKALETTVYETEYRAVWPDSSTHHLAARGMVHRDSAGHPVRMTGICWDITDRRRADEALKSTVRDLERSNRELERFAYISAHDLQEPLRQVQAFVRMLQERHADKLEGKAAQYFRFVCEGAARMSDLVQGLLDYSRVGAREQKHQPVSCQAALDAALANLQTGVAESHAHITHDELPTVSAEPVQLEQLFQNLIGNAIKFRPNGAGPEIHVGCRREGEEWLFWVKDNGIGIAPEFHEKIFQIFQRLHTQDKYPGTGIGLAVCKKIVEQHGGRIWIDSTAGQGSTFYFTLPPDKA